MLSFIKFNIAASRSSFEDPPINTLCLSINYAPAWVSYESDEVGEGGRVPGNPSRKTSALWWLIMNM